MTDEDSASLVFVDIDDFKSVNDTYGHAVGDYWIEKVAKFLRSDITIKHLMEIEKKY